MIVKVTPELLADLRKKAEAVNTPSAWRTQRIGNLFKVQDGHGVIARECTEGEAEHIAAASPAVVLALLDRIEALEKDVEEMTDAFNTHRPVDAERLINQEGRALARATLEAKLALEVEIAHLPGVANQHMNHCGRAACWAEHPNRVAAPADPCGGEGK